MIDRNHGPLFASAQAARHAAPRAAGDRLRILRLLDQCGSMTDEQMQAALGMNPSTQRPRRGELVKAGLVHASGRLGRTASGCKAVVWELTPSGRAEASR